MLPLNLMYQRPVPYPQELLGKSIFWHKDDTGVSIGASMLRFNTRWISAIAMTCRGHGNLWLISLKDEDLGHTSGKSFKPGRY